MSKNDALVRFELRDSTGIITLNRPAQFNAVHAELAVELGEAIEKVQSDPTIRVGVITGAGKAFCAGMDLGEFAEGRPLPRGRVASWGFAGIVNHPIEKPLIAAVNGAAVGGGLEIALSCDLICVDETAKLGLPEVRRGIVAVGGGLLRVSQNIPLRVALEIALTGRFFSAQEALRWGLINRVATKGTALESALGLAAQIVEVAPLAARASKRLIYESQHLDLLGPEAWQLNEQTMDEIFNTDDAHEGALAFTQKRDPIWTGS